MPRIKPLKSPRPKVKPKVPNPGSDAAIALGCTCPVLDNAHGKGYLGGVKNEKGHLVFVISGGCPLHGKINLGK